MARQSQELLADLVLGIPQQNEVDINASFRPTFCEPFRIVSIQAYSLSWSREFDRIHQALDQPQKRIHIRIGFNFTDDRCPVGGIAEQQVDPASPGGTARFAILKFRTRCSPWADVVVDVLKPVLRSVNDIDLRSLIEGKLLDNAVRQIEVVLTIRSQLPFCSPIVECFAMVVVQSKVVTAFSHQLDQLIWSSTNLFANFQLELLLREVPKQLIKMPKCCDWNQTLQPRLFSHSLIMDTNRASNKPLVLQLMKGDYLDHRENVLLVGPSGTGKSHLATALGMAACAQGKRVRFFRVTELITQLLEAKEDRQLQRYRQALCKLDLLVLDELGYVPASKAGAELLFDVIATAYERNSLIVTTNLPFENWTEVLGSERLTGAALDRLTHRCHILETKGESDRLQDAKRRRKPV